MSGRRDFRLFWFGETISEVGNSLALVAMSLLVVSVLDADVFTVGLLTAFAFLPWLVIALPAGAWIDRLPSRQVMIVADLVSAVLYLTIPVAAWFDVLSIPQVLAVAFLAGTANVFLETAYQVQVPVVVAAGELVEGNTKLQAATSVARLGGSAAGGFVVQAVGAATSMLFNAASFVVSAACLLALRSPQPSASSEPERPRERLWPTIVTGVCFVAHDRYFRPLIIWAALSNFGITGYDALAGRLPRPRRRRRRGRRRPADGLAGVGAVRGAVVATRVIRRFGTARGLILTTTLVSPLVLLIPLTTAGWGLALFAVGILTCVIGIGITNIIVASFRQAYTPPGMLGRVTATIRFILNGIYPIAALTAGGLATWLGVRPALWIMLALVALAGAVLLTPTFTRMRDLPTEPATPAARRTPEHPTS